MPERFEDLPVLAGLGTSLRAAMAQAEAAEFGGAAVATHEPVARGDQHARRWRRATSGRFGALSSVLVLGLVGTAAAAATLTILRGSPIPAPRSVDLQPAMTARAETQRILPLRAADPAGGPGLPYALRTGESQGGLTCVTVGQVDGDEFGIVGTDQRFRKLPSTLIDGCGKATDRSPAVAGARVLDADRYEDVRTIVYGVGGPQLRTAEIEVRGKRQSVAVSDGAFLTALRGFPEDQGLTLHLGFAGGRTATHQMGVGPMTVTDPSGPAWTLESGGVSSGQKGVSTICVQLRNARPTASTPLTANVCDATKNSRSGIPKHDLAFDVRTFRPGDQGRLSRVYPGRWRWHNAPARTIVWGHAEHDRIVRVRAVATDGTRAEVKPTINGAFAIVLPATVPAAGMRVSFEYKDGHLRTFDRPVLPIGRERG